MLETNLREGHKLVDRAYVHLRSAILRGELEPGKRLVETELAKQLGVSRSPIREAITRLEHDGLVTVSSLRVSVREVLVPEIEDLFYIRAALEGMAASLATPKLTTDHVRTMEQLCKSMEDTLARGDFEALSQLGDRFHDVFITACENRRLKEMLTDVQEHVFRFRSISAARPGRGRESVREHRAILKALRARNAEQAERLVRVYVLAAKAILLGGAAIAARTEFSCHP